MRTSRRQSPAFHFAICSALSVSMAAGMVACESGSSELGDKVAKSPLSAHRIAFGPVLQPNGDFVVVQRAESESSARVVAITRDGHRKTVQGPDGCAEPIAVDAAYLGDRAQGNVAVLMYCPALVEEMLAIVDVPNLRLVTLRKLKAMDKVRLDDKLQPVAAVAEQYDYVAHQYRESRCGLLLDANLEPTPQLRALASLTWDVSAWLNASGTCEQHGYISGLDWHGDSIFIIAGPNVGDRGGCGTGKCGIYMISRTNSTIAELMFGISGNPVLTAISQTAVIVVGEIDGVRGLWRIQNGAKAKLLVEGDVSPASVDASGAFFAYDGRDGGTEIRHIPIAQLA